MSMAAKARYGLALGAGGRNSMRRALGLGEYMGIRMAAERYDFDRAAGLISDELLGRFAFAGTPEQVAAQARSILEAGAARLEFGTPHGLDAETGLRLLGERVLPALRE